MYHGVHECEGHKIRYHKHTHTCTIHLYAFFGYALFICTLSLAPCILCNSNSAINLQPVATIYLCGPCWLLNRKQGSYRRSYRISYRGLIRGLRGGLVGGLLEVL